MAGGTTSPDWSSPRIVDQVSLIIDFLLKFGSLYLTIALQFFTFAISPPPSEFIRYTLPISAADSSNYALDSWTYLGLV
ncbi:hypothetical protein BJY04DRAFT_196216 [Aspergillus karnatakaensis]|uniref:uncharacterized protein n=1 Tax=Aspergillus karnatakaensis TaxID=1810916 RepID=UPI003CCD2D7F